MRERRLIVFGRPGSEQQFRMQVHIKQTDEGKVVIWPKKMESLFQRVFDPATGETYKPGDEGYIDALLHRGKNNPMSFHVAEVPATRQENLGKDKEMEAAVKPKWDNNGDRISSSLTKPEGTTFASLPANGDLSLPQAKGSQTKRSRFVGNADDMTIMDPP